MLRKEAQVREVSTIEYTSIKFVLSELTTQSRYEEAIEAAVRSLRGYFPYGAFDDLCLK